MNTSRRDNRHDDEDLPQNSTSPGGPNHISVSTDSVAWEEEILLSFIICIDVGDDRRSGHNYYNSGYR